MKIIKILWTLPQTLLGALLWVILRPDTTKYVDGKKIYYSELMRGSVSLGEFIFCEFNVFKDLSCVTERHEIGHYKQSLILGWFYLLIVGLPSLLHACLHRGKNYRHFYTEHWADDLVGENKKRAIHEGIQLSVALHLALVIILVVLL